MGGDRTFTISRRQLRLGNGLLLASLLWLLPAWWVESVFRETLSGHLFQLSVLPAYALMIAGVIILRRAWKCPKCERLIKPQGVPFGRERGGIFYCPHCGARLEVK